MAVAEKWKGYKNLPPDAIERIESLKDFWRGNSDILLVYLFGSLTEREDANDIDIAILFRQSPPYDLLVSIKEAIHRRTGIQRVDLIDLNRTGPVFRFDIIRSGRILYGQDDIVNNFEAKVIKEHMDTEYLRKVQKWFLKEKVSKKD
jgi:predicted nucleotidyltransferase